jgi:hypothetical protein
MGLFSRKNKSDSINTNDSRNNSTTVEAASMSSQSSLKSPATPGFSKMASLPTIPKIAMPKAPDPHVDPAGYLRSIGSVRERCSIVLEKAKRNQLNHFEVDMSQFEYTTKFVVSIIKVG